MLEFGLCVHSCKFGMGNHALVFGATGIQGWAVVNEILNCCPSEDSFDKVTALTNRPITESMLWPASEKLQVVSGINLLTDDGHEGLVKDIRQRVDGVDAVTHMFFFDWPPRSMLSVVKIQADG